MKNQSENSPSKMHQILKKLETYKEIPSNTVHHPSIKKYKHSSSIRQSMNSINNIIQNSNNENQLQKNQINIHKQALQTLTDAALNVQNLLSDFLVNVDPDDKRVYHIEDELKRIKHNNMENPLNFYTFMKSKKSHSSSDEDNFNGNKNIFRKRKTSNFNRYKNMTIDQDDSKNLGFIKMKSKKKKKFSENFDENNFFIKKNTYERFLTTNSLNKKKTMNSVSNENNVNETLNNNNNIQKIHENVIENKDAQERKFSNLSSHLIKKRTKVKFSDMKNQSSENILKNLNRQDSEVNKKETLKSNTFKIKLFDSSDNEEEMEFSDKNKEKKNKMMELRRKLRIENKELLKKRHSFVIPYNLSLKKKPTNKSVKDELDKKDKIHSSNVLKDYSNLKKYNDDKTDIRNYLTLSKKGYEKFNNLCENLRKSFISSPKDHLNIKENLNLDNNFIRKKTAETANSDKLIRNLDKTFKEEKKDNNNIDKTIIEKNSSFSDSNDSDNINKIYKELHFRRMIRQNKLVYDSLSDEELLDEFEGEFYLNPNGYFVFFFDMILLFLSIYAIIFPPFEFAFHVDSPVRFNRSIIMEFIIDSFFIFDFFLSFFRAYVDFDEQLISNNRSIIIHYFKTWFVLDLISGIPYNSIFILFVERVKKKIMV